MHTRRVSTFLLGAWLGCSLFVGFIVLQNLHSVGMVMNGSAGPVSSMIKVLGQDQMTRLLHHQAAEQNRNLLETWEQVQILLGLVLGGCLYFATQKRLLSLVLCAVMLALVMFQFWGVTPELTYRGREADFAAAESSASMVRLLLLYQIFVIAEGLKFVVGGVLTSYLFAFRTSRKRSSRREAEVLDQANATQA
jgi:hypothetical protein